MVTAPSARHHSRCQMSDAVQQIFTDLMSDVSWWSFQTHRTLSHMTNLSQQMGKAQCVRRNTITQRAHIIVYMFFVSWVFLGFQSQSESAQTEVHTLTGRTWPAKHWKPQGSENKAGGSAKYQGIRWCQMIKLDANWGPQLDVRGPMWTWEERITRWHAEQIKHRLKPQDSICQRQRLSECQCANKHDNHKDFYHGFEAIQEALCVWSFAPPITPKIKSRLAWIAIFSWHLAVYQLTSCIWHSNKSNGSSLKSL